MPMRKSMRRSNGREELVSATAACSSAAHRLEPAERAFLIGFDQPRIAGDIGGHDCRKSTLDAIRAHRATLPEPTANCAHCYYQGSSTLTAIDSKSLRLRVTTIRRWTSAVAGGLV